MKTFAIAVLVVIAGMPAVNATELNAGLVADIPTSAQVAACWQDAHRLCGAYLDGPLEVLRSCMQAPAHKTQISAACREAFK